MEHAYFCLCKRLLQGLNDIDWSESIKESQRNWIGKSVGLWLLKVKAEDKVKKKDRSFTTRPDTILV
jgi:leucyl-tRNA synthetase